VVMADSSGDELAPRAKASKPKGVARFDKDAILEAVQTVRQKMPHQVTAADMESWNKWHEETPAMLDQVAVFERPLPLRMPMKHTAVPAPEVAVVPTRQQKELITYTNPGGNKLGAEQLHREALHELPLTQADLPIGSSVAIRRRAIDPWIPVGYGTHFYVADVLAVHLCEEASSSSSAGQARLVESMDVQFRLPMIGKGGEASDEEHRGWLPACFALHAYDKGCERRRTCIQCRPSEDTLSSRFSTRVDASTIFETGLKFTRTTSALDAPTKRKILQSAPASERDTWAQRLHHGKTMEERKPRKRAR